MGTLPEQLEPDARCVGTGVCALFQPLAEKDEPVVLGVDYELARDVELRALSEQAALLGVQLSGGRELQAVEQGGVVLAVGVEHGLGCRLQTADELLQARRLVFAALHQEGCHGGGGLEAGVGHEVNECLVAFVADA